MKRTAQVLTLLSLVSCKTVQSSSSATKGAENQELNLSFNPSTDYGQWQGWGTSLAWWAGVFGDRDDLADIFFTTKSTNFNGRDIPGLGLNIARYNAGASSTHVSNNESMVTSKNMIRTRAIETFWHDWNDEDPNSGSWNWNADAKQRNMLQKAKALGANRFELFSNSPVWWMLKNHNPSGGPNGDENLQSWNYQKHAIYLATVAVKAKNDWGIHFESIEPLNEPIARWWKDDGSQEGAHFERGTQATLICTLNDEIKKRDLGSTFVSASDENTYDDAVTTWKSFNSTTRNAIGRINVHGYQELGGRRDSLYSLAQNSKKVIWNSEYGEDDASGLRLAKNLLMDFQWLHPVAWAYWQVLDGGGWGLIQANPDDNWIGSVNNKYYVLAQFTRHIRPGMKILKANQDNAAMAYDENAKRLVIVALNDGDSRWMNIDLSNFRTANGDNGRVRRWATSMDARQMYSAYNDTNISNKRFNLLVEGHTIETFEIDNVEL